MISLGTARLHQCYAVPQMVYRQKYKDRNGAPKVCRVFNYDFIFHGQRYRGSTECKNKTRAKAFEDDMRKRLERALSGLPVDQPETRIRTVSVALDDYQELYAVDHAAKSLALVKERGVHLRRLLSTEIAAGLTETRMQRYRKHRLDEGAGTRTIDMEVGILARAFGAKWSVWWPKLKPLDKGSEVGKVITSTDEPLILEAAAKAQSPYLFTYLVIAFDAGFRAGEIRHLKWDRFVIGSSCEESYVRTEKSKTEGGKHRAIPMEQRLWATMVHYRSWYESKLGEPKSSWYVFPFGNAPKLDPTRPITNIKKAWQRLKAKLKVDYRLHDTRHTLATAMAVAGVPEAKRRYLMGHVDENVIRRYTHLQAEDCRADLKKALASRRNTSGVPIVSPIDKPKTKKEPVQ